MKLCDASFVVDNQRHIDGGAMGYAPHREEDRIKKKRQHRKATCFQPTSSLPPSKSFAVATPAVPLLRKTTKKQQTKKKAENDVKKQDAADLLCQDSVKSRNHKLVLAPAISDPSTSSFCVSNNFPSWGGKQKRVDMMKPTHTTDRAVTDALHEEILEYTMYTKTTVGKMAVHIEEVIANVRSSVVSMWPQSKVETFGSYSTGIWLPSSDVDLVILDVVEVNDAKLTAKYLKELAQVLETKEWVESLLVLEMAKVPVLKLVSAGTSVPIDITFESAATHSGLLARDLIKRYADTMPELYPLAIVFKQLLRERDLNDAYTGGLSSYSVVLMLIHFSQLWRNGDSCFEAASIYASGSLPPVPSTLASNNQPLKAERIQADSASICGSSKAGVERNAVEAATCSAQRSGTTFAGTKNTLEKSSSLPLPALTSSYAAIVSREKQQASGDSSRDTSSGDSSRDASSGDSSRDASSNDSSRDALSEPRFSYAAVAAGIVKVSETKKLAGPPSSYAAAVSAPAGSSSSASRKPIMTAKKQPQDAHSLDAISVSSSNADTEDSSSSCSHSSSTDSDDESAKVLSHQPPASLGEHTMMILEFFGIIFDYRKNGLSVRDGGYIYRLADSHRSHVGKPALVIEDPIHPDRNVSASSFAFSKVVALFEDSYYALKYFRPTRFTPSALSCLLSTSGHSSHMNDSHSKVQSILS